MKNLAKFAVLGAALALAAPFASATSISAGGTVNPTTGVSVAQFEAGTATIAATASGTFTGPGLDYVATFSEIVVRGGSFAACPTCLTFIFTVNDVSGSSLESSTIFDFSKVTNNVYYIGGSGPAVTTVNDNLSGASLQFVLGNLANGKSTTFADVTNATLFQSGNISVQNGVAGNAAALAPAVEPEPSSLILLGTGLVSTGGMLLRRRKINA